MWVILSSADKNGDYIEAHSPVFISFSCELCSYNSSYVSSIQIIKNVQRVKSIHLFKV
jgi:hypothetical protein